MRHFAHHIGDYAAATAHLPFIEDAAYHRLLRRYYQDEKPLPADLVAVQRLVGARTKDERSAVEAVLREFFTLEDDGWHQARADREIEVYRIKTEAARENGTKGGRPRNQKITQPVTPSVQSKKLSTPHSPLPIKNSEPNGSGARAPAREVIFQELLPWLNTRAGKDCRAFVGKLLSDARDDDAVRFTLEAAEKENPIDPVAWISAQFRPRESARDRQIREATAAAAKALQ